MTKIRIFSLIVFAIVTGSCAPGEQEPMMSFFLTSAGPGNGAALGGLEGADEYCQSLADAVGSEGTWHAYMSTSATADAAAVNARDRIGAGPWLNQALVQVASEVDNLHSENNNLTKAKGVFEVLQNLIFRLSLPAQRFDLLHCCQTSALLPPGADFEPP